MARKGKKYREASEKVERRPYPLEEAIGLVKNSAYASFDETVEVAMRLGVNTPTRWSEAPSCCPTAPARVVPFW